jgi:ubiquinone/menaquinone biosynthesis methyltransferase
MHGSNGGDAVAIARRTNAAGFSHEHDDVFARIATRYDLLCDVFSIGIHRHWKATMAARMAGHARDAVLDAASGTGDIPLRLLRRASPKAYWVTDVCPQMLAIAENKIAPLTQDIRFALCDAEDLKAFADGTFGAYSISFGMKICDRRKVIAEALRVLKPGGRFYCLEAARIVIPALHGAYLAYMRWCMPLIGRLAAEGDASAYAYLLRGVHDFPDQETFAQELRDAGFTNVSYANLSFGIVALHEATKPRRVKPSAPVAP